MNPAYPIYNLFDKIDTGEYEISIDENSQSLQFNWVTRENYRDSNIIVLEYIKTNTRISDNKISLLEKLKDILIYYFSYDPERNRVIFYLDFPKNSPFSFAQKINIAHLLGKIFFNYIPTLPGNTTDIPFIGLDFLDGYPYDLKVYGTGELFGNNLTTNISPPIGFISYRGRHKKYLKLGLSITEFSAQFPEFGELIKSITYGYPYEEFKVMFISSENQFSESFDISQIYIKCSKTFILDKLKTLHR